MYVWGTAGNNLIYLLNETVIHPDIWLLPIATLHRDLPTPTGKETRGNVFTASWWGLLGFVHYIEYVQPLSIYLVNNWRAGILLKTVEKPDGGKENLDVGTA